MWEDMVATTTVDNMEAKEVHMQPTGQEKARVTVCMTAKADGTTLKPFIVTKATFALHRYSLEPNQKCY